MKIRRYALAKKTIQITSEQYDLLRILQDLFESQGVFGWKRQIQYNGNILFCYHFPYTDTWGCSHLNYTTKQKGYEICMDNRFEHPIDLLKYIMKTY